MNQPMKDDLDKYLQTRVPEMIETHLGLETTRAQVARTVGAVIKKIGESSDDPYRSTIHFLAGLLTFCLGVMAAVFSALNSGGADPQQLSYKMLGGVLGSIAFVAWLSTIAVACIQLMKFMRRYNQRVWKWPVIWRAGLMLALALVGGMAVAYCVRYGYAILAGVGMPVGLLNSLTGLFRLAF